MEDIATKWVLVTVFVFTSGALVALVWSVIAGQWTGMTEAALIPLQDGDDVDDRGRPHGDSTMDAERHAPLGS